MRMLFFAAGLAACAAGADFTLVPEGAKEQTGLEPCSAEYVRGLRELTDRRIAEIAATPNMAIPEGAKKYHFSSAKGDDSADGLTPATAWRTLAKLEAFEPEPGSYVLFERGGFFRGRFTARKGVTYTAYGEGPKPVICGSLEDGADPAKWKPTAAKNVWAYMHGKDDVGSMVFDGGPLHAIKVTPHHQKDGTAKSMITGRPFRDWRDLDTDLHFWHDYRKTKLKDSTGSGILYLYSEKNPGERFRSIEFLARQHIITVPSHKAHNVHVDNLSVKYTGGHGVAAGTTAGLKVTNCEFSWIGGSIQGEGIYNRDWPVRFGNAVEVWGGCDGYLVDNCHIHQVYDAGATHQFYVTEKHGDRRFDQKNVRYSNNVIEKCHYSIEYFLLVPHPGTNGSRMENVVFENNLMWDAGVGLCAQRRPFLKAAHIHAWYHRLRNRAKGYEIRNNLMAHSTVWLMEIGSGLKNDDGSDSMPRMEGNVVIGAAEGQKFGGVGQDNPCTGGYTDGSQAELNARGPRNRCFVAETPAR